MKLNANKIQDEARKLLKKNQINETIQYLEDFVQKNKIRDDDFSDNLVALSQRNREIKGYNLSGSISYQDNLLEKSKITKKLLTLINEVPILINQISEKEEVQSLAPAINYLEKVQDENLIEVRGRMINADNLLLALFEEVKKKEKKLFELEGKSNELVDLKTEIESLNLQIEEEKRRYDELKIKYDELKKEKQKIYELDFQIESLKAKLEGKERELEVLRESFVMSKQLMDSQRKEIDRLKNKYE